MAERRVTGEYVFREIGEEQVKVYLLRSVYRLPP
jgi:hypothetical protein